MSAKSCQAPIKLLAIFYKSCHSERVKKILAVGYFLLFLILFSLLSQSSTTYAYFECRCLTPNTTGEGNTKFRCQDVNGICMNGLACINSQNQSGGGDFDVLHPNPENPDGIICLRPKPTVNCHCENNNESGSGKNRIICPGLPQNDIFCDHSGNACIEDPNSISKVDRIPDKFLKGIYCGAPRAINCTCKNPFISGSGANEINCTLDGRPYKGYCSNSSLACRPSEPNDLQNSIVQAGNNNVYATAQGIVCGESRATNCRCDSPGQARSGANGFSCDYNGQKLHGFCEYASQACQNGTSADVWGEPNWKDQTVKPGEASGIYCSNGSRAQPLPLANPPCAVPLDSQGRCNAAMTSFGSFATEPGSFILKVFGILLASSGAIAILLIMRAGYKIMTSRGNPEGIKEGREQITAAIVGLLFLIFSLVFLQIIGSDLLGLPSFLN